MTERKDKKKANRIDRQIDRQRMREKCEKEARREKTDDGGERRMIVKENERRQMRS